MEKSPPPSPRPSANKLTVVMPVTRATTKNENAESEKAVSPAPVHTSRNQGPPRRRLNGHGMQRGVPSNQSLTAVSLSHIGHNMIQEAEEAQGLFRAGRLMEAYRIWAEIITTGGCEAVRARAYRMLANEVFGESLEERCHLLREALGLWQTVIKRNGVSRFPIDKATTEQAEDRAQYDALRAELGR